MGDRLKSLFDEAGKKNGMAGKVKMAILVKMSSADAAKAPDSPESIRLFEEALRQL
jgi:hypothetical protein